MTTGEHVLALIAACTGSMGINAMWWARATRRHPEHADTFEALFWLLTLAIFGVIALLGHRVGGDLPWQP